MINQISFSHESLKILFLRLDYKKEKENGIGYEKKKFIF